MANFEYRKIPFGIKNDNYMIIYDVSNLRNAKLWWITRFCGMHFFLRFWKARLICIPLFAKSGMQNEECTVECIR